MRHALLVTYGLAGTTREEHAELVTQLGPAVDAVPGLVSRLPLENAPLNSYGALYVFDGRSAFDRFVASELFAALCARAGVDGVVTRDFEVPVGGD